MMEERLERIEATYKKGLISYDEATGAKIKVLNERINQLESKALTYRIRSRKLYDEAWKKNVIIGVKVEELNARKYRIKEKQATNSARYFKELLNDRIEYERKL